MSEASAHVCVMVIATTSMYLLGVVLGYCWGYANGTRKRGTW